MYAFLEIGFFPRLSIIHHSEGFCGYSSSLFSLKDPNAQLYFSIPIFVGFVFPPCAPMLSFFPYFLCFTLFRKGSQAPVFV